MFQTFEVTARPEPGPQRLKALRKEMAQAGLSGFLVPRADAHQGEYVAPCDARLAWLTGFDGSAGFCAALMDRAGIFVDGRYRVQVKEQVDLGVFTPLEWPEVTLGAWLKQALAEGGKIGFDPWLHTPDEIRTLRAQAGSGIDLRPCENLVDRIWDDRPAPPDGKISAHPIELAGESHESKRRRLARVLVDAGEDAAVLTLPDSICWLLNIRGSDIARVPVVQGFAILHADAGCDLFVAPGKADEVRAHLGDSVRVRGRAEFVAALAGLRGRVRVDDKSAPFRVASVLTGDRDRASSETGPEISFGPDPCILPKACKNATEIAGSRAAHLRDGAALVEFLAWLEDTAPTTHLNEIDVVTQLENFRRATGCLRDISFDTIAGAGPNGAIVHYRVSRESARDLIPGELLLLDSGGQYQDGTTDITRTLPIGPLRAGPGARAQRRAFSRVLRGMIAISRARWPRGLAGRDLDALARAPLWLAGQDYDHGTGHGVGAYLSVHEGPQRLSRTGETPLEPGMILSNEPGYYREGAFGIRIENLLVVRKAAALAGGDGRDMLDFETLSFVPIDQRLIVPEMLSLDERDWLNAYHSEVFEKIGDLVSAGARIWLKRACAPM